MQSRTFLNKALLGAVFSLFLTFSTWAQTATYNYQLLDYSPDGGQTTYATQLMGISGNYAVGYYNLGTGSAGAVYDISNAAWTSYQTWGSTLNRTILSGISGDAIVGSYATIYPQTNLNQPATAWYAGSGLLANVMYLSARTSLNDPNVDPTHKDESTFATGVYNTSSSGDINFSGTVVGYYLDASGNPNGFMNNFINGSAGAYVPIGMVPTAVEGANIIGNSIGNGGFNVVNLFNGITNTYLQVPWTAKGTYAGGISGDWIAGSWEDFNNDYHGYLYNIATEQWLQVNDVPGSQGTSINGIDGDRIVGGWVSPTQAGGGVLSGSFIGTLAVPEPSTYLLFGLGALALARAWRNRD
jgi:hypothetical protein